MLKISSRNVISFITVCGFFIGLMFCMLNVVLPFDILLYTLEITLFFYLLGHVITMVFTEHHSSEKALFNKKAYEDMSMYFINALSERENVMENLMKADEAPLVQSLNQKKKRHDESYKKQAA